MLSDISYGYLIIYLCYLCILMLFIECYLWFACFIDPALMLEMICLSCWANPSDKTTVSFYQLSSIWIKPHLFMVGFGLNQALSDGIPLTMAGTQEYAAPEVLDGGSPSEKQDVCLSLSRWWFETFFYLYPKHWGYDTSWRAYFSNGLVQPPTSCIPCSFWNVLPAMTGLWKCGNCVFFPITT